MALYRFFFAPVLLVVAVVAGRAEKARAPAAATEMHGAPTAKDDRHAAPAPPRPARERAARTRALRR